MLVNLSYLMPSIILLSFFSLLSIYHILLVFAYISEYLSQNNFYLYTCNNNIQLHICSKAQLYTGMGLLCPILPLEALLHGEVSSFLLVLLRYLSMVIFSINQLRSSVLSTYGVNFDYV